MLHEVLLSLSGFPSPLFDPSSKTGSVAEDFPLLSPPEKALLSSIGHLALRHRELREHVKRIASSHHSTVCRAVAGSISAVQLARFQQKILDVEARILKKDASTVAAYDVVPLAAVVGEFDEWKRRMDWLWEMSTYMLAAPIPDDGSATGQCSGAELIDKLRKESRTGFSDIEETALELVRVAETAWLRQLSSWVLHGRLPSVGGSDFCVRPAKSEDGSQYALDERLLPGFVSSSTSDSILFIGRSLDQIRTRGLTNDKASEEHVISELDLLPEHLKLLTAITLPISSAGLSSAITAIRLSLSRNTLQRLLPLSKITIIISLLYEFFLLGRGEFAGILIDEADSHLGGRGKVGTKPAAGVQKLVLKDTELSSILNKSFAMLSALSSEEHDEDDSHDDVLELARSLIHLQVDKSAHRLKDTAFFDDLLLSTPVNLRLTVTSPLDLFLSPAEVWTYSQINAYLLSIERAHMHLTSLWRLTSMRRDHPCPSGPPVSNTQTGRNNLKKRRERRNKRERRTRKFWATIGKTAYFLTELIMHLEGTIVKSAWNELNAVISGPESGLPDRTPTSAESKYTAAKQGDKHIADAVLSDDTTRPRSPRGDGRSQRGESVLKPSPRDPSSLAALHRAYLGTLSDALLLTDKTFTKELKLLLLGVENLVAQMKRLDTVQVNLDLEEDDGVVDALNDWAKEEQAVLLDLDRARKKTDEGLRSCIEVLGQLDTRSERLPLARVGNEGPRMLPESTTHPDWNWRAPGVDRLLMKLEFTTVEGNDSDAYDTP